jgi:hypothetical protein
MKTDKKIKKILPEVHILGDLQDVKNLVQAVNKKKTIVIFQENVSGELYLEIDGEIQLIRPKDITRLEKDYRLIYFTFFPGDQGAVASKIEEPAITKPEKVKKKDQKAKDKPEGKPKRKSAGLSRK